MGEQASSEKFGFPFDSYDYMGYLAPGFAFGVGLVTLIWANGRISYFVQLDFKDFTTMSIGSSSLLAVLVVVAAYIAGHVIAMASSLMIDKVFIDGCSEYPSKELLFGVGQDQKSEALLFHKTLSRAAVSGTLAATLAVYLSQFSESFRSQFTFWLSYFVVLVIYCIAAYAVAKRTALVFQDGPVSDRDKRWMAWVAAPLNVALRLTTRVFRMNNVFPQEMQKELKRLFGKYVGLMPDQLGTEVYWLVNIWVHRNASDESQVIKHFLRLYSFTRNLCAAVLLLLVVQQFIDSKNWRISLVLIFGAATFLIRYYYLYRNYYTKYLFRSFYVAASALEQKSSSDKAPSPAQG